MLNYEELTDRELFLLDWALMQGIRYLNDNGFLYDIDEETTEYDRLHEIIAPLRAEAEKREEMAEAEEEEE